ncbi:hypothetical protein GCM10025875_27510 [Litorihabitans aurantiacus]|uniref:Uncharacterized protein n=1 Tax=Litorihabitans aurantiacus TaxID=1930061 RepID=A0AA37XGB3_9MICO|nr:hypothetical protein GCM10025875_27510 [Litorihabitans aurantiacus]
MSAVAPAPAAARRRSRTTRSTPRRAALALAGAGVLLGAAAGTGAPAVAAPAPQPGPTGASVSAVGPLGEATASPDGPTTLTLTGSGFQSIDGGFGGIYVLFGWVADGAWQPSAGGGFGVTYAYQPDVQAAENSGYQKFVTFPGSTTASEANGSEVALDGSWATDLVIPGPVLQVTDASGANPRELDCRVETCGVITFGAHGVVNANNETFTPISFTTAEGAAPVEEPAVEVSPAEAPAEEAPADQGEDASAEGSASAEEPPASAAAAAEDGAATADDESGSSSAAPWIIAGTTAAAAIGSTTAAVVAVRRRKASSEA